MRVLFICRQKTDGSFSPIIQSQANSLINKGLCVTFWGVRRGGVCGYIKAILELRSFIKKENYEVYHAHYSYSGIVAAMAGAKPLVVSLMGSDLKHNIIFRKIAILFNRLFWNVCIVKSEEMASIVNNNNRSFKIPNGVDLNIFKPINLDYSKNIVGFKKTKNNILYVADPSIKEKNFNLAAKTCELLSNENIEMHVIHNVPHEKMPYYLSAADVLILTSYYEGSPNIIKEAMACNCPIVATDVGDIRWLFGDTRGCFIADFNPSDFADKVKQALEFKKIYGNTEGRNRLKQLKLDSESVALRVSEIYKLVV